MRQMISIAERRPVCFDVLERFRELGIRRKRRSRVMWWNRGESGGVERFRITMAK